MLWLVVGVYIYTHSFLTDTVFACLSLSEKFPIFVIFERN